MSMQNSKGFTLVELMVAVAIIGILSVIAVPSYHSFQARARQKQGFSLLNGYYAAAIAAKAEYGFFPGNLVGTGFAPVGELNYRLRANDNPSIIPGENAFNNDHACFRTFEACDCAGNCPNFKTWNEMPAGAAGRLGIGGVAAGGCPTLTLNAAANADIAFTVGIAGWISTTAASRDRYAMNEQKTIEMCDNGLN